jgi:hypothetical protein
MAGRSPVGSSSVVTETNTAPESSNRPDCVHGAPTDAVVRRSVRQTGELPASCKPRPGCTGTRPEGACDVSPRSRDCTLRRGQVRRGFDAPLRTVWPGWARDAWRRR